MSNKKMMYVIWIDGKKEFVIFDKTEAYTIFEMAVKGYGENRVEISVEFV